MFLGAGTVTEKALSFCSKVVLARLLVPEDIGLVILIVSLTAFFETLTEVGIKHSVIQNKDGAKHAYLNTAWWFQSLRGLGLYVAAFLLAPLVCRFYFADKPQVLADHSWAELHLLVRVAFLTILFNGLVSPRAHVLEKEFKFGKTVFLMQGSAIVGAMLTIVLAFVMRNVWAMVVGMTGAILIRCVLSYVLCPFMPRLAFDRESFTKLLRFARGLFGSPFLAYLAFNLDVLVAAKILEPKLLGMYGMAKALALMPQQLFARVITPVLLPAFSEKQDDRIAMCTAVIRLTRISCLFVLPFVLLAALCSETILTTVFTAEYSQVKIPFSIVCLWAPLIISIIILTTVFFGIGKPQLHRAFVAFRCLLVVIAVYPATKFFGLTGTAMTILAASFLGLIVQVLVVKRILKLDLRSYLLAWFPGILSTLPGLLTLSLLRTMLPEYHFVHLAGAGVVTCVFVVFMALRSHPYSSHSLP